MQVADIAFLIDYNYWANRRVLAAAARLAAQDFAAAPTTAGRTIRGALVHQFDVEWSWRMRWQGRGEVEELDERDYETVEQLAARWQEDEQAMRAYIATLSEADLAQPVALGGSKPWPLWTYILHVINHGTQQRSDAALLLTLAGCSPGDLDIGDFAQTLPGYAAET